MESAASVTQLLSRWSQGDRTALEELAPRVQRELHSLARTYLKRGRPNQTLQPTALINEAWLRLMGQPTAQWENRSHFFGIAARLMRIVLVDHARARRAIKRGGALVALTLEHVPLLDQDRAPDILEVNEALDQLAKVDKRKA